jgi:hypothetical protein
MSRQNNFDISGLAVTFATDPPVENDVFSLPITGIGLSIKVFSHRFIVRLT